MEAMIAILCAVLGAGVGAEVALLAKWKSKRAVEETEQKDVAQDVQERRIKQQFENFMAYDGSGRGQKRIEP